jgi:hypothetical protein
MRLEPLDRRLLTLARLEQAQDAFVVGLRRLRALEELAVQLRAPLDLQHAHDLWTRILHAPLRSQKTPAANQETSVISELQAARVGFHELRELLRCAEAEAFARCLT